MHTKILFSYIRTCTMYIHQISTWWIWFLPSIPLKKKKVPLSVSYWSPAEWLASQGPLYRIWQAMQSLGPGILSIASIPSVLRALEYFKVRLTMLCWTFVIQIIYCLIYKRMITKIWKLCHLVPNLYDLLSSLL